MGNKPRAVGDYRYTGTGTYIFGCGSNHSLNFPDISKNSISFNYVFNYQSFRVIFNSSIKNHIIIIETINILISNITNYLYNK